MFAALQMKTPRLKEEEVDDKYRLDSETTPYSSEAAHKTHANRTLNSTPGMAGTSNCGVCVCLTRDG